MLMPSPRAAIKFANATSPGLKTLAGEQMSRGCREGGGGQGGDGGVMGTVGID